jgi:hypothetical protein
MRGGGVLGETVPARRGCGTSHCPDKEIETTRLICYEGDRKTHSLTGEQATNRDCIVRLSNDVVCSCEPTTADDLGARCVKQTPSPFPRHETRSVNLDEESYLFHTVCTRSLFVCEDFRLATPAGLGKGPACIMYECSYLYVSIDGPRICLHTSAGHPPTWTAEKKLLLHEKMKSFCLFNVFLRGRARVLRSADGTPHPLCFGRITRFFPSCTHTSTSISVSRYHVINE